MHVQYPCNQYVSAAFLNYLNRKCAFFVFLSYTKSFEIYKLCSLLLKTEKFIIRYFIAKNPQK